jgi:hypothetical protein
MVDQTSSGLYFHFLPVLFLLLSFAINKRHKKLKRYFSRHVEKDLLYAFVDSFEREKSMDELALPISFSRCFVLLLCVVGSVLHCLAAVWFQFSSVRLAHCSRNVFGCCFFYFFFFIFFRPLYPRLYPVCSRIASRSMCRAAFDHASPSRCVTASLICQFSNRI